MPKTCGISSDEQTPSWICSNICKVATKPLPARLATVQTLLTCTCVPPPVLLLPPTAGMGLPGLLCAKLGAQHALLTDYEPVVVAQIQQNAELNAVDACSTSLALDWFDLAPLAAEQRHAFDLLLLADVIYAAAVVGPLVNTLCTLMRPQTGEGPGGQRLGQVEGTDWGHDLKHAHAWRKSAQAVAPHSMPVDTSWLLCTSPINWPAGFSCTLPACHPAKLCRRGAGGPPHPAAADLRPRRKHCQAAGGWLGSCWLG